ncbi:MAG: hypothetical protein ACPG4T_02835 [Nannocystaceae bacterium]
MKRIVLLIAAFSVGLLSQATCTTSDGTTEILTTSECTTACAFADRCGFLPSSLGWNDEGDTFAARKNCEIRCTQTRREDPVSTALLTCLSEDVETNTQVWCDKEDELYFTCGHASRCLEDAAKIFDVGQAIGEAEVLFSLLPQDAYDHYFGLTHGFTVDLQIEMAQKSETCETALCSDAQCEDAASGEGVFCDSTLCNISIFSTQQECERLGVLEVEVGLMRIPDCECNVTQDSCDPALTNAESTTSGTGNCTCDPDCPESDSFIPSPEVLGSERLSNDSETTSLCAQAIDIPIPSNIHRIAPGPALPYIRVRGELPLQDLLDIGFNPNPDETDTMGIDTDTDTDTMGMETDSGTTDSGTDDTGSETEMDSDTTMGESDSDSGSGSDTGEPGELFAYCWQFRGPALLVRSGITRVIAPFPSIDFLEQVSAEDPTFYPIPCL